MELTILGIKTDAQPTIAVAPINTAGLTGSTVTLFCTWQNSGIGKVRWFNHIGSGSGIRITDGDQILGDTSKYGLTGNHGSGEYNLQIKSLTDSDVGDYACETQLADARHGAYIIRVGNAFYSCNKMLYLFSVRSLLGC